MWRCAIAPDDRTALVCRRAEGMALLTTVIVLMLLSAIGLGLALTASLEPAAVANYEAAWQELASPAVLARSPEMSR